MHLEIIKMGKWEKITWMSKFMEKETATILMCTFNAEKYIEEQIQSLLAQTYDSIEIIIYDDSSRDKTVDIIEKIKRDNVTTKTIELHINDVPSGGANQNFKKIISDHVDRHYVFLCDQDDIWDKYKVELMMNRMLKLEEKEDKPYLLGHSSMICNSEGEVYDHKVLHDVSFFDTI